MRCIMLFFLLTVTISCYSQHDTVVSVPIVFRGIGSSFQSFDGLSARIANRPEYKELPNAAVILELGWLRSYKRVLSGLSLAAGSSMSGDREKKSSALQYLGAGLDFGYDVLPSPKIMLYPLAGIGIQAYRAKFYKDNSAVPFNDVLQFSGVQNSIRSVNFINGFFTYRLGLGIGFSSAKHPYSTIGLQARYTGSFKDRTWKSSENQTLSGAPRDRLSQFQITVVGTMPARFIRGRSSQM